MVALAPDASPSSSRQQHPVSPGHGKGKMKSRGKENQKCQVQRAEEKVPIHLERAHLPQGLQPTLGSANCFICGKAGHLAAQCPSGSQSRKEHLPARTKIADAMMVTDTAMHADEGIPHLSSRGWFEIQDGGASSMGIGHNTLMKLLDHMGERGVKTSRFLFHPTDKVFALEVMPAVKYNG